MKKLITTASLLILFPMLVSAQSAPSTDHPSRGDGYLFFGLGNVSNNGANGFSTKFAVVEHVGGGGEVFLYKGLGVGAEVGYAHWGANGNVAWIPSGDVLFHLRGNKPRARVDPFVLGGISGYIPTSHGNRGSVADNLGGGVNLWFSKYYALRLEFRDYTTGELNLAPGRNYASFRIGVTFR
jgi:hypothetical protein